MNTRIKIILILVLFLFVSACSSKSALPGIGSEADTQATEPVAQAPQEDQDEEYNGESDLIDPGCHMENVFIIVDYDHLWTWSPDGTENTGSYIGTAKGTATFLLNNDGYGNFASDTDTIFYSQEGEIQGNPDKCTIEGGRGMAEMMLYGTCTSGVIELEWLEADTGESDATMVCDDKTSPFPTYHPIQFIMGLKLGDDGLGYKQSNTTDMEGFRDVSMEWTFRYVPEGQEK